MCAGNICNLIFDFIDNIFALSHNLFDEDIPKQEYRSPSNLHETIISLS